MQPSKDIDISAYPRPMLREGRSTKELTYKFVHPANLTQGCFLVVSTPQNKATRDAMKAPNLEPSKLATFKK